ncbi:META domain-containing protein [Alcanivorax sp.]|uniref:META domain-containing protein n=1 Tax=Alcanivorax sp. TaxID=1872427 RepID=UPI0025C2E856|nr:META domain-containing protein [Alcanivorax sp.]|tara:strand:- start:159 stop:587 length:429 start_codon:yes stop_codon:yes gene_type:complete
MNTFRLSLLLTGTVLALAACTGQPTSGAHTMIEENQLRGDAWSVTSLNGESTGDATLTLNFHQPGQLAGKAACNNYMASYVQSKDSFTIQTGGMTMKACPPPLMDMERQFVDALKGINHAKLNKQGHLILTGSDGIRIEASR